MTIRKVALPILILAAMGCAKESKPLRHDIPRPAPVGEFDESVGARKYYDLWKTAEEKLDLCEISIKEVINDCDDAAY